MARRILGGTETLSWRWIFFVNLPVSAAAIVLTLAAFGAYRKPAGGRFDLAGVLAFTAGAAASTVGLVRAGARTGGAVRGTAAGAAPRSGGRARAAARPFREPKRFPFRYRGAASPTPDPTC